MSMAPGELKYMITFMNSHFKFTTWQGIIDFQEPANRPSLSLPCTLKSPMTSAVNADQWPESLVLKVWTVQLKWMHMYKALKSMAQIVLLHSTQIFEFSLRDRVDAELVGSATFATSGGTRTMIVLPASSKHYCIGFLPFDQEGFASGIEESGIEKFLNILLLHQLILRNPFIRSNQQQQHTSKVVQKRHLQVHSTSPYAKSKPKCARVGTSKEIQPGLGSRIFIREMEWLVCQNYDRLRRKTQQFLKEAVTEPQLRKLCVQILRYDGEVIIPEPPGSLPKSKSSPLVEGIEERMSKVSLV